MKTMLLFLSVVAGCVWSQFMFFGLPQTGRGWLWFISTTLIVAAAWALIESRKARK